MSFASRTYLSYVRQIVQYLGNGVKSTEQIEAHFPNIPNIPTIMQLGIRQGWACRTQLQPDLWRANVNMMYLNYQNILLQDYVGSSVRIPPVLTEDIQGKYQRYNSEPRNLCNFTSLDGC